MNFVDRIELPRSKGRSLSCAHIEQLAYRRLVEMEQDLAKQGYQVRAGVEVEFHVVSPSGPTYGALDLAAIEKEVARSPYVEAVKSSGLHTLLPEVLANAYTQQYEIALGSLTKQNKLRPPSVLARATEQALSLVSRQLMDYRQPRYAGQVLMVDYQPKPAGAFYPADTQISASLLDLRGHCTFYEGEPVVARSIAAMLALQRDAFEIFAPLRDVGNPLPGATKHLKHSQRLPYYRHRNYSVHTIAGEDGNVRLENRMIAPDVSPNMPMLLTVGALWLASYPEKINPEHAEDLTFPRSHK